MKNIGIVALAAIAGLVLGFGVRSATPTAYASVDDSAAIGCEFLAADIDGDPDDATIDADVAAACDGISAAEVTTLAGVLGDEAVPLTVDDLADDDLDANQLEESAAAAVCATVASLATGGCRDSIYVFAFVDDDGPVDFNAEAGVTIVEFGGDELCDSDADDLDCGATADDGDGVVVATVLAGSAVAGDEVDVCPDQDGVESCQTLTVTGIADDVSAAALEDVIETSGDAGDVTDCVDDSDVSDGAGTLAAVNQTFVKATVTDTDGVELARVPVGYDSSDDDIAELGEDTFFSVDAGAAGIGGFAVVCGGTDTGDVDITATINAGGAGEEDSTATITVVGAPASVALTASPAIIACDGTATSTVTAVVTDSEGNNVADGTNVNFSVVALGTANPINADTAAGSASSVITPLSAATAGVTVIVTSGSAQSSIRVDCALPVPTATVPGAVATPTRSGVRPPDTGSGGYMGQDSSSGIPTWTLIALGLGSLALVAGGLVTRRAGK